MFSNREYVGCHQDVPIIFRDKRIARDQAGRAIVLEVGAGFERYVYTDGSIDAWSIVDPRVSGHIVAGIVCDVTPIEPTAAIAAQGEMQ